MALQEVHTGFTFNFDGSKFAAIQKGVGRASTNLNTIAAKTEAFTQKMGGFVQRARQVVGVYLGFRAVRAITSDYADAADATAKFASGLGISAQQYQRVAFAADLSGISVNELNMALPKLAKSAGDAADGSKSMAIAFDRAGVDIKNTEGKLKDPITLLTEMADGMKNVKDEGRRTQILMNIFGRAGKKMGVLLDEGSAGIKKMMEEADKLGIVLSQKDLKAAERFKDSMLRLKSVFIGVRNIIAAKVVPTLSDAMDAFRLWWLEGRNAERALRALKLVAIFTGIVIARLIGANVLRNIKLFVQGIWAGVQALRAMGVAGAATALKIWAIVAAFAIVALAIEDLIGFAQGKDSVIGRILGDTQIAKDLRKSLLELGTAVKQAWVELAPVLKKAWADLKPEVVELWKVIRPLIGPTFRGWIKFIIFAFKLWGFAIGFVTTSLKIVIATFSAVASIGRTTAESVTIAWEDASDFIAEAWEDLGKIVSNVAKAMGVDLGVAAAIAGKAWDAAMGGISTAVGVLTKGMERALAIKNALFGVAISPAIATALETTNKAIAARQLELATPGSFAPTGGLFGLGPAAPAVTGTAGLGVGPRSIGASAVGVQQTVNTAIAAGAASVTINVPSGDPAAIAAALNAQLPPMFNKMITDASRDLVKPPRGQR